MGPNSFNLMSASLANGINSHTLKKISHPMELSTRFDSKVICSQVRSNRGIEEDACVPVHVCP